MVPLITDFISVINLIHQRNKPTGCYGVFQQQLCPVALILPGKHLLELGHRLVQEAHLLVRRAQVVVRPDVAAAAGDNTPASATAPAGSAAHACQDTRWPQ